jgi:hypothetical protein
MLVQNIPEVKLAVTSSGEDLSRAIDFSAAYARGIIVGVYEGRAMPHTSRTSGCFLLVSLARD